MQLNSYEYQKINGDTMVHGKDWDTFYQQNLQGKPPWSQDKWIDAVASPQ